VKESIDRHDDHDVGRAGTFDLMTFRKYSDYELVDKR